MKKGEFLAICEELGYKVTKSDDYRGNHRYGISEGLVNPTNVGLSLTDKMIKNILK